VTTKCKAAATAIFSAIAFLRISTEVFAQGGAQAPADLSDFQQETLTAIKDLTSSLLYLAVGVFALVGGYLAKDKPSDLQAKREVKASFLCYGISLLAGLTVMMNLTSQLQAQEFNPNAALLRWGSIIQIFSIGCGSVLFYLFLVRNIK
jgi:hypothetical protein